jgi:hypothetical protein
MRRQESGALTTATLANHQTPAGIHYPVVGHIVAHDAHGSITNQIKIWCLEYAVPSILCVLCLFATVPPKLQLHAAAQQRPLLYGARGEVVQRPTAPDSATAAVRERRAHYHGAGKDCFAEPLSNFVAM